MNTNIYENNSNKYVRIITNVASKPNIKKLLVCNDYFYLICNTTESYLSIYNLCCAMD